MDGVQIKHQHAAKVPTNKNARTFVERGTIAQDTIHLLPFATTAIANSTGPTKFPGGNDPDDNTSGIGIVSGNGSQNNPYIMSEAVVTAPPIEPEHINTSRVNDDLYHHRGSSGYPSGYYSSSGSGEANPAPSSGNNPDAHPSDVDGKGASHPGQKNWGKMNNNEKVAHVLKAIEYAKQQGIAVNLNQYFTNLPSTGNTGLGGQYRISGTVIINGKGIPVTIQLPISRSERIFHTGMLGESPKYVGRTSIYDSQYNYYFGKGNISINSATIMVPAEYNDDFYDFIN